MKKFAKWGAGLLALVCAFGLGRGGSTYDETDLALAREEAYNSGYHAGYDQGTAANQEALYTEAFSEGRLKGYDEGLAEGLKQAAQSAPVQPEQESAALTPSLPVFTPDPTVEPAPDRNLPAAQPSEDEPTGQVVYVTRSGTKYHLGSCSHLSKSKIEKSLSEAKNAGYEPCKTCNPPK